MQALSDLISGKKSPNELIQSSFKRLQALQEEPKDSEEYNTAVEKVAKYFRAIKAYLLGDVESEAKPEQIERMLAELAAPRFFYSAVANLAKFEFETKKDTAQIFNFAIRKGNPAVLMAENDGIVKLLVDGCDDADVALHCGSMLREAIRHESVARRVLVDDHSAHFFRFFDYVQKANFDLASDAFDTFKMLLTRHKALAAQFLEANYEPVFSRYNDLIQSDNYVTKRQSIKLLGEVILDRTNFNIMMRYINEVENLKILMNLLRGQSKTIQFEAFHVFKVFVANPNKHEAVAEILAANRDRLIAFLHKFKSDKDSEQFIEEKNILISTLEHMEVPAALAAAASSSSSAAKS